MPKNVGDFYINIDNGNDFYDYSNENFGFKRISNLLISQLDKIKLELSKRLKYGIEINILKYNDDNIQITAKVLIESLDIYFTEIYNINFLLDIFDKNKIDGLKDYILNDLYYGLDKNINSKTIKEIDGNNKKVKEQDEFILSIRKLEF